MVTAEEHVYSRSSKARTGEKCTQLAISESTCTATSSLVAVRLENGREYLSDWKLEDLERFIKKLRPTDQIAVEVTGNTRLFHDAVKPHVSRVVAVDPNQFKVISHSVKKTGP